MSRSTNPFDDDYNGGLAPVKNYSRNTGNTVEDDADYYEREIEKYMQESLDSTERSRRHLDNSERLGVETANNLLAQREQLENTERNLDDIQRKTQETQRNLNSLKSFMGGWFKNKFTKKPMTDEEAQVKKQADIPQSKSTQKLRDQTEGLSKGMGSSASFSGTSGPQSTLSQQSKDAIKGTRWEAMDQQIDENLDSMSSQLRNLRSLGENLGREVDDQNKMLDRIDTKARRNDDIVRAQDKQMQKLLGTNASSSEAASTSSTAMPSLDTSTKMSLMMKGASMFK